MTERPYGSAHGFALRSGLAARATYNAALDFAAWRGMKLYTKQGDDGSTGLIGGARVRKNDARVAAYGEVDETNAAIGFAVAAWTHAAYDFYVLGL